jgi:hypothetical protein
MWSGSAADLSQSLLEQHRDQGDRDDCAREAGATRDYSLDGCAAAREKRDAHSARLAELGQDRERKRQGSE